MGFLMTDKQADVLRLKLLGAMLRKSRMDAGLSVRETAGLLGIRPARLSAYERGEQAISLPELELLAFHFRIPLRQLWDPEAALQSGRPRLDAASLLPRRHREVAERMRAHREQAGMSNAQLAAATDIPPRRLARYQRGERPIPLPDLERIIHALGRRIEEYMDNEGPIATWEKEQQAKEVFQHLPEELREFISDPANRPYLNLAMQLSQIPPEKLRALGEGLLDLTL